MSVTRGRTDRETATPQRRSPPRRQLGRYPQDYPLGWTTDRTNIGGPSHLVLKRGTPEYTQRAMGLRDDPFRCPGQIRWYCTMSCRPKKSSVAIFRSFVTGTSMEVPKNITAMAHRSQRIRSSLSHGIQVSFKYLDKIFMCHNL